jgi:hypothetical protein
MDDKDKQRTIIEFLPFEGCAGEEIVTPLRNMSRSVAPYRASVFKWISETHRGNEELRSEKRPGRPDRHETDAAAGRKRRVCVDSHRFLEADAPRDRR